jgi:glycosyltransferase involved in cell wall biosynthesis
MKGSRVLYISYDGMTDPLGQSQVIPYLTGLAKAGYAITIVSAEKSDRFSAEEEPVRNELNASGIDWHPVLFSNRIPGFSAWMNYRRLQTACKSLFRQSPFDIVHARSDIPAIIGLQLKKKFKSKLIFDMRGFWADERVDGGSWNLSNPVYHFTYRYFRRKEDELLKKSDAVVTLTHKAKEYLLQQRDLNLTSVKIHVIPCCADMDLFSPVNTSETQRKELRLKLNIGENDLVLSYSGSLGTWYMTEEMLRFFKLLLEIRSGAKFLIITRDDARKVTEPAKRLGIPSGHIIVVSAMRNEMPVLLSLSRLAIFFIRSSFSKIASSPTKMGEVLAMGIPVVCNAGVGDAEEIIQRSKAGVCLSGFTEEELKLAAVESLEMLSMRQEHARKAAEDFFSLETGTENYIRIYSQFN